MKKRILTFFICTAAIFSIFGLSACSESCMNSCASCLFKPTTPTEQSVREDLNEHWGVDLPKNIELINYAINFSIDDGLYYYIFDYDGSDETFNSLLSSEKDEEFEKKFLRYIDLIKDNFVKEYTFPDLSEEYLWTFRTGENPTPTDFEYLFVLYFSTTQQLIVYKLIW